MTKIELQIELDELTFEMSCIQIALAAIGEAIEYTKSGNTYAPAIHYLTDKMGNTNEKLEKLCRARGGN